MDEGNIMEPSPSIPQQILQIEVPQITTEPKKESIEFDIASLPFPKYKYSPDEPKSKRSNKTLSKPLRINFVPQVVKKQQNKKDKPYQMDVHEYSYLNLYLDVDIRRGWNA